MGSYYRSSELTACNRKKTGLIRALAATLIS